MLRPLFLPKSPVKGKSRSVKREKVSAEVMPKSAQKKARKKSGWKNYQNSSQTQRRLRLGMAALFFLIALLFVSKVLGVAINLNRPYSPENGIDRQSAWEGEGRLNIAVKADSLYLLSFNPQSLTLNLVKIPDQTYLQLPLGYGQWQAGSVYQLGQSEKPPLGGVLLEKTLTAVFGLPVDRYLILSDQMSVEDFQQVIEGVRQNPGEGLAFLRTSKTNLTPLEYARLWWGLRGLRTDKIKETDLTQGNITDWLLLSDGSRVLSIDSTRLDQFVQNNLTDNKLGDDGLTIGVFNGTEHAGLADRAAREIANMGGRVIFITNFPIKIKETVVFGSDSSYSSQKLARIFAPRCVKSGGFLGLFGSRINCSAGLPGVQSSRADINVVVGEDFFLEFNRQKPNQLDK